MPEIDTMLQVCGELMGEPPTRSDLQASAECLAAEVAGAQWESRGPLALLLAQLRHDLPRLDDNARGLILEAAFRVACSDEEIEPEEDQLLRNLAEALGIGSGVLELEIERFHRSRLSRHGAAAGVVAS